MYPKYLLLVTKCILSFYNWIQKKSQVSFVEILGILCWLQNVSLVSIIGYKMYPREGIYCWLQNVSQVRYQQFDTKCISQGRYLQLDTKCVLGKISIVRYKMYPRYLLLDTKCILGKESIVGYKVYPRYLLWVTKCILGIYNWIQNVS